MASDNHTTIVGNLVDDPELRSPATAPPWPTCGSRSPSASNKTASGATARPASSRSNAPVSAAMATALLGGRGRPSTAATSTTHHQLIGWRVGALGLQP
jgi:hypothetical protein